MKNILPYLKSILIAVVLVLIIRTFVFNIAVVNQTSMYPTLHPKDLLFSNAFYRVKKDFKRGDIIIFKSSYDNKLLIKRIIGLPGETVEIIDGKVYINGEVLNEDYLVEDSYTLSDKTRFEVADDELFVMGDNRTPGGSFDSREFGPIKISSIRSKPIFRMLPLKSEKFINKNKDTAK